MKKIKHETHGGNIYRASETFNVKIEDIIDFSANINPLGIPGELKHILISGIDDLVNYPDPEYCKLRDNISKYLKVPFENIITGNGATEIIFELFNVLKPNNVLLAGPTFLEYEKAACMAGVKVEYIELEEKDCFELDIDKFASYISRGLECLLLCNPNNPTSTLTGKDELEFIIKHASKNNVMVIIDEAFIELTVGSNNNSMVEYLEKYSNLFIIRAFTKIFAIPGLRLGYGLGNSQVIRKMWERKLMWSVNSIASCAGDFLPLSGEYLDMTSRWLAQEKKWLYEELCKIDNLKVFEPQTNFILIKILDDLDTNILGDKMGSRGILLRNASNFRFLNSKFFRVAVKDRNSNLILVNNLKEELFNI